MKQEQKELLLKDLCARLPYGVHIHSHCSFDKDSVEPLYSLRKGKDKIRINDVYYIDEVKPYLFPLSSMTEEQSKIYHELIGGMFGTSALINFEFLEDFFYRNHLDYKGLIPMGLAEDATGKNIY